MTDRSPDLDAALAASDAAFRDLCAALHPTGIAAFRSTPPPELNHAIGALEAAITAAKDARTAEITGNIEGPVNATLKAPFTPPDHTGDHHHNHRPGRPRKIDTDPDLRAFVEARIDHLTFEQIAAEVAAHFPATRRIGRSAIHAWWKRSCR